MKKIECDLAIVRANELLTIKEAIKSPKIGAQMRKLGIIENGGIAIRENKIIAVDESSKLLKKVDTKRKIDASGKIVMPGFVDPHTHLVFAGSRENELDAKLKGKSYLEILKAGGGILSTVETTRNASKKALVKITSKILNKMLTYGTTTVETKSGYGLTVKDEIKMLETVKTLNNMHHVDLVPTFLGAHAVPLEFKNDPEAYVNLIINEMLPRVANMKLAEFCDVFCEKDVFNINQSRRILEEAKNYGLKPKIHADEMSCTNGAELAAEVRAISAEHLLHASEDGIKAMSKTNVIAVLLPVAPFTLLLDIYANARKIIEENVPVALGTDMSPSCWNESMQLVITFACFKMRITTEEAIVASTINAAYAINRAKTVGSLEAGKNADILIMDVPNYKFIPYHFGVNLVDTVIKNGKIVVKDGKLILG